MSNRTRSYKVEEQTRIPLLSLVFAFGPMLLSLADAALIWIAPPSDVPWLVNVLLLWSGALLAFLAGVRRGLTFRSPDGETPAQIATMFYLFVIAVAALFSGPTRVAASLLMLGFTSVGILDWMAARRQEVPPYFARLRPVQMLLPVISLLVVLPKI